jgi:hypothetical protein
VRIYVDTSVIGGYFDPEFEIPTRRLFAMFERGEARLVLSDLTIDELLNGGGAPIRSMCCDGRVTVNSRTSFGARWWRASTCW